MQANWVVGLFTTALRLTAAWRTQLLEGHPQAQLLEPLECTQAQLLVPLAQRRVAKLLELPAQRRPRRRTSRISETSRHDMSCMQ